MTYLLAVARTSLAPAAVGGSVSHPVVENIETKTDLVQVQEALPQLLEADLGISVV